MVNLLVNKTTKKSQNQSLLLNYETFKKFKLENQSFKIILQIKLSFLFDNKK